MTKKKTKNEVDALLDELSEAENATPVEVDEQIEAEVLADIEAQELKQASYDAQQDATTVKTDITPAKAKAKGVSRQSFATKREAIEALGEDKLQEILGSSLKAVLDNVDGIAKKVGEKAVNALQAAITEKSASRYTQMGLDAFFKAEESITCKEIETAMLDKKVAPSTARAQSQQMMQLFTMLGIAVRDGKSIKVNDQFKNLDAFKALAA